MQQQQQQQQQQPALRQGAGRPQAACSTRQGGVVEAQQGQRPMAGKFAPAGSSSNTSGGSSSSSSGGGGGPGAIRRGAGPRARRHAPYGVACGRPASSQCTQSGLSSGAAVHRLTVPPLGWQRCQNSNGGGRLAALCNEQERAAALRAGALQHQTLAQLLDVAISLASRSLLRTMRAFQTACDCWALAGDNDAVGRALDCAEVCMARTIHRMQIAQQLATAVLSRQAAGRQQQQQQHGQEAHLLALFAGLQRQCEQAFRGNDDEGEAEVSSS